MLYHHTVVIKEWRDVASLEMLGFVNWYMSQYTYVEPVFLLTRIMVWHVLDYLRREVIIPFVDIGGMLGINA